MFSFVITSSEQQDYRPTGSKDVTMLVCSPPTLIQPWAPGQHSGRPSPACRWWPALRNGWVPYQLSDLVESPNGSKPQFPHLEIGDMKTPILQNCENLFLAKPRLSSWVMYVRHRKTNIIRYWLHVETKKSTNELINKMESQNSHRCRKQTYGYPGIREGKDKWGDWDWYIQTTI